MKKSLIALLISSVLVLSACDDQVQQKLLEAEKKIVQLETDYKTVQDSLTAKENELTQTKTTLASKESELAALQAENEKHKQQAFPALQVEIVPLFKKTGVIKHSQEKKEEFAPEQSEISVSASTAKTGVEWLDQLLLQELYNNYLSREEQDKQPNKAVSEADMVKFFSEMYQTSEKAAKEDKPIGYEDFASTYYVGQRNNIVSFTQNFYNYTGGAHGMYHTRYLNIDINKKAVITLNDLVSPKNQNKLKEQLWAIYVSTQAEKGTQETELFTPKKEFFVAENFYFDQHGITFVYPVYALAAYAEGETELTLSYDELKDLLNPDYRPSAKDGNE